MKLKQTMITLSCLGAIAASSANGAVLITTPNGTVATGVTWTTTAVSGINFTANGMDGDTGSVGNNDGFADSVTITFSSAVDLIISAHGSSPAANFSNVNGSNTFAADTGSWSYTAGSAANDLEPGGNPIYVFSGSTLTTNLGATGNHNSGLPVASEDWGQFAISGITEITWTLADGAFIEAFSFTVDADPIPEPSSALLIGLGGLACMKRRRRS